MRRGSKITIQIVLSKYIRHQIYHTENINHTRFTNKQLQQSIRLPQDFIKDIIQ